MDCRPECAGPWVKSPRVGAARGHRREGELSPCAAAGQRRGAEVRAPSRQAPGERDDAHRPGACECAGALGRRREFPWCDAHRQVLLASSAVSSVSASSRRGYHAQPLHSGVLDEPRHRPAGAACRCAECAWAREWGAGDGRDLAQSGARGEGQDAHRVAVAGVRRCRGGGVSLRAVACAPSCARVSRPVPRHVAQRRLRGVRVLCGAAPRGGDARAVLGTYQAIL